MRALWHDLLPAVLVQYVLGPPCAVAAMVLTQTRMTDLSVLIHQMLNHSEALGMVNNVIARN